MKVFDAPPVAEVKGDGPKGDASASHPWRVTSDAALKGKTPDGKDLDTEMAHLARLAVGLEKPQSVADALVMAIGTTPMMLAGGAGAVALAERIGVPALTKAAPLIGRMMTTGGLSKARGESNLETMIDLAGAGMAEGTAATIGKVLGVPADALVKIGDRIGQGPDAAVNRRMLTSLLSWWKADPDVSVQSARALKVARQLNDLDPEGVAGKIFKDQVVKGTKIPLTHKTLPAVSPGASTTVKEITASPVTRAAGDAVFGAPPASALAAAAIPVTIGAAIPHSMKPKFMEGLSEE